MTLLRLAVQPFVPLLVGEWVLAFFTLDGSACRVTQ